MSWIKNLFSGKGKSLADTLVNGLDEIITNKEELAQVKLLLDKETHRHMEQLEANILREYEFEIQDRSNARNREIEVMRGGSKNITQNVLAYMGIIAFFYMTGYIISRGLGEMSAEESFIIGNLTGLAGAIAKDIYSYYFGSSIGSRNKDVLIEKRNR
ncbi:MAG: hypothetical protein O9340_12135 [Cyclobacteriaceae bacterium]|jgi:hypothetical protein|nr:hypothetical protein [Cyclobacteriaceae bacterium]